MFDQAFGKLGRHIFDPPVGGEKRRFLTKVSRKSLGTIEKAIAKDFWEAMDVLTDAERIVFFSQVFTPTEIRMFAKRVAILKALKMRRPYDEIREKYAVMPTTIGGMSNIIHRSGEGFTAIIEKLIAKPIGGPKKQRRRVYGSRTAAGTKRVLGF